MAAWTKYFTDDPEPTYHTVYPVGNDPRRCHGRLRRIEPPQRCRKWAVRGYDYCISHYQRLYRIHEKKGGLHARRRRVVTGYYSAGAGTALKTRLEELRALDPSRRHSLAEEVDLARIACEKSVRMFEAACMGEQKASPEAQAASLALLRQSLDHVAELVAKAARARRDSLETVDVEQLDYIVDQVIVILNDEVEDHAILDRCKERFKKIKIPERKGTGGVDRAQVARMFRDAATAIDESVQGSSPATATENS